MTLLIFEIIWGICLLTQLFNYDFSNTIVLLFLVSSSILFVVLLKSYKALRLFFILSHKRNILSHKRNIALKYSHFQ